MASPTEAFMREGIERFPEAYRALRYFNQLVVEQIEEATRRKTVWKCGLKIDGRVAPDWRGREKDCWSSGVLAGTLGETAVRVDIGLWWSPPDTDGRPIVYLNPCSGIGLPEEYRPGNTAVACAKVGRHVRLYLPLTKDTDTEKAFSTLLEELDRALTNKNAPRE